MLSGDLVGMTPSQALNFNEISCDPTSLSFGLAAGLGGAVDYIRRSLTIINNHIDILPQALHHILYAMLPGNYPCSGPIAAQRTVPVRPGSAIRLKPVPASLFHS